MGAITRGWHRSAIELARLQLLEQLLDIRVGQIQTVPWASGLMGTATKQLRGT